jgi:hypothetical protein
MGRKMDNIELAADLYNQVAEQIDINAPFPQDVTVKLKMNFVCDEPSVVVCKIRERDE